MTYLSGENWTKRQRELIAVAGRMFAERGYHDVGINDLTRELNLSGPSFYRHFPSKQAILVGVLDNAMADHLDEARKLVASITDARKALEAVVAHHVNFAFEQTHNIMTWRTEFRVLPEEDRRRLRYLQRLYVDQWVRTVGRLRPELATSQITAMCYAAITLLQSHTALHNAPRREELQPILQEMAVTSLLMTPITPQRVKA